MSTLARLAAGLASAFAAAALAGWILGIPRVADFGLGLAPMGPAAATCFLLAGAAVLLRGDGFGRAGSAAAWACAAAIAGIAGASFFATLLHLWAGAVPLPDATAPRGAVLGPWHCPFSEAGPFLLTAIALASLGRPRRSIFDWTSWLGLSVLSFGLHVLLSARLVAPEAGEGYMGPASALAFIMIGASLALGRIEPPLLLVFRRGNPVGFIALRLLAAALLIPSCLLPLQAWWDSRLGAVLQDQTVFFTAVSSAAFLGLVLVLLMRMERLDRHRTEASEERTELLARLQQQAASLQHEVSERTLELRESNERLQLALQSSGCGVWDWDPATGQSIWDARQCAIYGLGPGQYGGRQGVWESLLHPEDRARALDRVRRALESDICFDNAYRVITHAGEVRHIESRGFIRRDAAGKCTRVVGIDRDVTHERKSEIELLSLAERLKFALGSAGYGVWEKDLRTNRLAWDDRMFEIYGVRREDFHGTDDDWKLAVHPDDRPATTRTSDDVREGRTPSYEDQFRIIRPDGSTRHIEARGFVQRDADGAPSRVIGLNRDATEDKELREQLRIAEERWQLALAGNNDGLWDWNVASDEFYFDDRWAEMIGYAPGEIPRHYREWEQRVHPDDLAKAEAAIEAHFAGQTPLYMSEHRLRHKTGRWVWILDRGKIVSRDARGVPLRVVGTHTDISVSKELEERLRDFESMALQMGRLAEIGPWNLQVDAQRMAWSPEVHRIHQTDLGFEPTLEGMLGFYEADAQGRLRGAIAQAVRLGNPFDLELPMRTARGEQRWVRILGRVESKGGVTSGLYGAVQNITAIHESEDSKHRLETQLFQAQKMETLGTLAGGIAHDFNNLLTGILGYQELALDGLAEDHPSRSCLDAARGVSMRARELVEQILTLSRTPSDEMATVDLSYVIDEARRFLRTTVPANVAIEADIAPNCGPAHAEATQIHQVLLNLGQNAVHAMGSSGGTLRISLAPERLDAQAADALGLKAAGPYLRLVVSDTGHGMDAETQKRIFDPFFTTKGVGQGTGLGLSVVHGVVRAHRGAIKVVSAPGKGAAFTLYLRCAETTEEELDADDQSLPRGNGELVCIVDDEDFVLSCVAKAMDKLGYRAVAFDSPDKCLEALQGEHSACSLLVTDQTMPGMTGTELAAKARGIAPHLPIIIMSGYFSKISPTILAHMDRVSLVSKPFTAAELAQAVHKALRADS